MAFDAFSDKTVKQETYQQQIGLEVGPQASAFVVGGGASLVSTKKKGRTEVGSISIYDPSAALAAINANQQLSTQAISFANINANQALQAVQTLAAQLPTVSAGGNPAELLMEQIPASENAIESQSWLSLHKGRITIAIIAGLAVAGIIYGIKKIKK
jgi:hypothetical protein